MQLKNFIEQLSNAPETIDFEDSMALIDSLYDFTATDFSNGDLINKAGDNSGSCKIFYFAKLNNFNPAQTLNCFGRFYRVDVLQNPAATSHQNIRNFIAYGWQGINFANAALVTK